MEQVGGAAAGGAAAGGAAPAAEGGGAAVVEATASGAEGAVEATPGPAQETAPATGRASATTKGSEKTASMFGKEFKDEYLCDFCGTMCVAERVRLQSKKKQTYKRDHCNSKMTQLHTIYKGWPSAEFKEVAKGGAAGVHEELALLRVHG